MYPVCAGQIKAARAILGWSQEDLALATRLAVNTIRNIEMGHISPRNTTNDIIRKVIENAGLEFTEGEGVKRRCDQMTILQGPDSCDAFIDDIIQTVRKQGGDIAITVRSQNMLMQSCGIENSSDLGRLERLGNIANVQCLIAEAAQPLPIVPLFQFRLTSKQNVGPNPCFVYGDRFAMVLPDGAPTPRFAVFKIASVAQSNRSHFLSLWENGQSLLVPVNHPQRQFVEA